MTKNTIKWIFICLSAILLITVTVFLAMGIIYMFGGTADYYSGDYTFDFNHTDDGLTYKMGVRFFNEYKDDLILISDYFSNWDRVGYWRYEGKIYCGSGVVRHNDDPEPTVINEIIIDDENVLNALERLSKVGCSRINHDFTGTQFEIWYSGTYYTRGLFRMTDDYASKYISKQYSFRNIGEDGWCFYQYKFPPGSYPRGYGE